MVRDWLDRVLGLHRAAPRPVHTERGPSRDRHLAGKARVRARRSAA